MPEGVLSTDALLFKLALSSLMCMMILFRPICRLWHAIAIYAESLAKVSCSSISIQSTLFWKQGMVMIPGEKVWLSLGLIVFYQVIMTS